jgi:transposase
MIAARMLDEGLPAKQIAQILQVNAQTVRLWRRIIERHGIEALQARIHAGPQPRLSDEQKQQFLELLGDPPIHHNLGGASWTTASMAALIQQQFQVAYHPNHVGQMMHDLGYTLQRPDRLARERNQQKIDQWREQTWVQIAGNVRQTRGTVVFIDEVGFSMSPCLKAMWAPRGHTPIVLHRNRWYKKVSAIGALSVSANHQVQLHVDWYPGENVNQGRVVLFLERLLARVAGPITVVWDNLSSHKGKAVRALLKKHRRLTVTYLPAYAPELNPIEIVWSTTKYHRMANHAIADLDELHQEAMRLCIAVGADEHLLLNCVRHTGLGVALGLPPADRPRINVGRTAVARLMGQSLSA